MKICRQCRKRFEPKMSTLQMCCSPKCAIEWARTDKGKSYRNKVIRKENKERKDKLRTKRDYLKTAQKEFNAYIRARDSGLPCISCGKADDGVANMRDCSHYRSVGSAPELRFEELNAHASCKKCNRYLSGNIVEYRLRLKEKIGQRSLNWLEGPHNMPKLTIDDLKILITTYRNKKKELINERDNP